MTVSKTLSPLKFMIPLLLIMSVVLVSCGDKKATTSEPSVDVSPQYVNNLPEDLEGKTLTISNGAFEEDGLELREDEPTVLNIVNRDDQAYQFKIEGFLLPQDVPGNTTTTVSFTTPTVANYTGQLIEVDGKTVVSEIDVVIQSASGL